MSKKLPQIILHIGQHKTGSKALQSLLAQHALSLANQGCFYPVTDASHKKNQAYANSHYRLFALLRIATLQHLGKKESAERVWTEQRDFCLPHKSLGAMFDSMD